MTTLHVLTTRNILHTYLGHHLQMGKHKEGIVFSYGEETMVLDGKSGMLPNLRRLLKMVPGLR